MGEAPPPPPRKKRKPKSEIIENEESECFKFSWNIIAALAAVVFAVIGYSIHDGMLIKTEAVLANAIISTVLGLLHLVSAVIGSERNEKYCLPLICACFWIGDIIAAGFAMVVMFTYYRATGVGFCYLLITFNQLQCAYWTSKPWLQQWLNI